MSYVFITCYFKVAVEIYVCYSSFLVKILDLKAMQLQSLLQNGEYMP